MMFEGAIDWFDNKYTFINIVLLGKSMRGRQKDRRIQVKVEHLESFHVYLNAASEMCQPDRSLGVQFLLFLFIVNSKYHWLKN